MSASADDAGLTDGEADRFAAIVAREWPDDVHPGDVRTTTDVDPWPIPIPDRDGEPTIITVYRPGRPGPILPLSGTVVLAASLAVAVYWGVPAYQRATGHVLGRAERIDVAHDLGVIAAVLAIGLVVACAMLGAWVVRWARYRLRRTAVIAVHHADQMPAVRRIQPPNIATALTWVLLLATATTLAPWWMSHQLDLLATSALPSDVLTAVERIAITGAAWCAVLVVTAAGLVAWAAREGRHQLRARAHRRLDR